MSAGSIALDQIRALSALDTPTVANAMEGLGIAPRRFTGPEVRLLGGAAGPVVGIAATGTMKEQWGSKFAHLEPWLKYLEEVERTPLPVIAVLHDESEQAGRDAMLGEGMSRTMRAAGTVAAICDGAIRDIDALREMGFPVWGRGTSADRGRIRFHRYQVPVEVGGMTVHPGDIIHADSNGAIVVPTDRIAEVARAAEQVAEREAKMFEMLSDPAFRIARLYEFYTGALKTARGEV